MLHIIFIILFFFFLTFSQPAMKGTLCLHSRSQNKWLNLRILAHEITLWNSCSCFLFYPTSLPKYNALIKCLFSSEENYSKQKFRFDEKDINIIVGVGHYSTPSCNYFGQVSDCNDNYTILCTFPEVVFNLSIPHQLKSSLLAHVPQVCNIKW
jgi:hypothetical protein